MSGDRGTVPVAADVATLDRWARELDELFAAAGAPTTARRPWLACWARHHRDWSPWVIPVHSPNGLAAAALLARRQNRGLVRVTMLGQGQSDYACLPCRGPDDAARLADEVVAALRGLGRPWTLHLTQLPAGDPVVAALAEKLRCAVVEAGDPSPIALLSPGTDLRPTVRKNARKITARARNRLVRQNVALAVERTRDAGEVVALLPEIAECRAARDRDMGRSSDHADDADRGFWYEVLPLLAKRGELEVTTLRLAGRLAAYAVALLDPPAYRVWDTRIEPELRDYAPGHLLRDALLEGLHVDARWSEFDTMRGTEQYKSAAATELHETVELLAWSSPVVWLPWRTRRAAKGLRDRHPTLARLDAGTRGALRRRREASAAAVR